MLRASEQGYPLLGHELAVMTMAMDWPVGAW